jgi:hypothetical protein
MEAVATSQEETISGTCSTFPGNKEAILKPVITRLL